MRVPCWDGQGFGGQVHGLGAPPQAGVLGIELIAREVERLGVCHRAAALPQRERIETREKSARNL
jgi:hypothetical protein